MGSLKRSTVSKMTCKRKSLEQRRPYLSSHYYFVAICMLCSKVQLSDAALNSHLHPAFGLPSIFKRQRSQSIPTTSTSSEATPTILKHTNGEDEEALLQTRRKRMRQRVSSLARNLVQNPPLMPQAVAAVLKDATLQAVDMAIDEVTTRRPRIGAAFNGGYYDDKNPEPSSSSGDGESVQIDAMSVIEEAFGPLEESLDELDAALTQARTKLKESKLLALDTMQTVQAASIAQAEGAQAAISAAEQTASEQIIQDLYTDKLDVTGLAFDDVGYDTSEMAPPFLDEDSCLVPGEPVVRVEKAPENSRRIFAGIDIMASVDTVWGILTDYENLQRVVPNLVVNDVLELYEERSMDDLNLNGLSESEQCGVIAKCHKGSLLKQVGGAKVAGIQFSARTTLEVREWPKGLPDVMHFEQDFFEGKSRKQRAKENRGVPLERFKFPRPFSVSQLPTRDVSMQSIPNDDGEFRMYQGVWRMQPLPGCGPPGVEYMRLTYAVEVSPRAYLPVSLVEGRIVRDLCTNLEAIRDFVQADD